MTDTCGKDRNILKIIRQRAQAGDFVILLHAVTRSAERDISAADIAYVLKTGERETNKDEFKEKFQSWNYAMRGLTLDNRSLRIAVAFDETGMLIVTVIPLGKKRS